MFVKNVSFVTSNVLVISLPFTLRDVGDVFLFPFFESTSLIDFQVFLISALYFSNVYAKTFFLAAHMLVLNILLYVLRFILNVSYSLDFLIKIIPKSY